MNLTKFGWTKTELKRIYYEQNTNMRILESVFWNQPSRLHFQNWEAQTAQNAKDCGVNIEKLQGLLMKFFSERVCFNLERWSLIGRLRRAGGVTGGGRPPERRSDTVAPWKPAGALGFLATVNQTSKEKHQRDEELTADLPRALARAARGRDTWFATEEHARLGEIHCVADKRN